jgi:hypothetical protein
MRQRGEGAWELRVWRPNLVTKRFIRARRAAGLPHRPCC